jgi:hypothetical protein
MALKFDKRRELETLPFFQLGEEEGKGLNKICFAPLVAAGVEASLWNCTVQSVWGYVQNKKDLTEEDVEEIVKCTR